MLPHQGRSSTSEAEWAKALLRSSARAAASVSVGTTAKIVLALLWPPNKREMSMPGKDPSAASISIGKLPLAEAVRMSCTLFERAIFALIEGKDKVFIIVYRLL
jgi:hypothetical protein